MSVLAKGLRRIADHIDPAGSHHEAIKSVLSLTVRDLLALKRATVADARATAKNFELPNFTGK